MSPTGEEHGSVTANLTVLLGQHVRANNLGRIYGAETGFKLESDPDTVLAPDLAFISHDRVGIRSKSYRSGPPDLAVEVISPGERKTKIEQKTARWLAFGAQAVWLVNPQQRTVEVILAGGERKLFHEADDLTDDTVPDFCVEVSEIFR